MKKKKNIWPVIVILLVLLLIAKAAEEDRQSAGPGGGAAPTQAPFAIIKIPEPTAAPTTAPTASARTVGEFVYRGRDTGPCGKLTGDVEIVLTFVSTPDHPWTEERKQAVYKISDSSIAVMEREAARYGVSLDLCFGCLDCEIPFEYESFKDSGGLKWYRCLLDNYFCRDSLADVCEQWKGEWNKTSVPVVFLFNSWDLSHAYSCGSDNPAWTDEFCVIFCDTDMHDHYLNHELLHMYGAIDLYDYNNEGVQRAAEKYFPSSNMLGTSSEVDELTAYLVGWTDALTWNAWQFVQEVDGLRD